MLLPSGREADKLSAAASLVAFYLGLYGGGMTSATLLYLLGRALAVFPGEVLGCVGIAGVIFVALTHVGVSAVKLPERTTLIPPTRFSGAATKYPGAIVFGYELGLGFRTRMPVATPFVLSIVLAAVTPSYSTVAILVCGWALGRLTPLLTRLAMARRLAVGGTAIADSMARALAAPAGASFWATSAIAFVLLLDSVL